MNGNPHGKIQHVRRVLDRVVFFEQQIVSQLEYTILPRLLPIERIDVVQRLKSRFMAVLADQIPLLFGSCTCSSSSILSIVLVLTEDQLCTAQRRNKVRGVCRDCDGRRTPNG